MIKSLVLFRHAHRELDADDPDNGLSARGQKQARAIAAFARERGLDVAHARVLASPKRRALETVRPLANGAEVRIDPRLDERTARETAADLAARVQTFLDYWRRDPASLTIACTHGDWLPVAYARLIGQTPDLPNVAWLEVEQSAGPPRLAWFVPHFEWWPST